MQRGKAFFVVGHAHWGKSSTLRALTSNTRVGWFEIKLKLFFIRRMSNDDVPEGFYDFLRDLDPAKKPLVIIALCPTFEDERERDKLIAALKDFKRNYELHFFVLRHAYLDERRIKENEIANLKRFGEVEILSSPKAEMDERGKAFEKFIVANI